MKFIIIICVFTLMILIAGCSRGNGPNSTPIISDESSGKASKKAVERCLAVDAGEKDILESQTFAIDFEPFKDACFVTAHDAGRTDPPIGSVISIYRNGKQIYKFDSRFNPNAASCWVQSVSFQDLTGDGLTDVIVLGMCGAKSGDIQGNEVFINTGKDFRTNVEVNDRLEKFKTVEEVVDFVRRNQQFFKE